VVHLAEASVVYKHLGPFQVAVTQDQDNAFYLGDRLQRGEGVA
jgi:hypothetical protein